MQRDEEREEESAMVGVILSEIYGGWSYQLPMGACVRGFIERGWLLGVITFLCLINLKKFQIQTFFRKRLNGVEDWPKFSTSLSM